MLRNIICLSAILCASINTLTVHAMDIVEADKNAVRIMVYFNVGNDTTSGPNITTTQFKAHMNELKYGDYNVVSLNALNKTIPADKNNVAITFDGGHKSILKNALPLLKEYGFPYTIFVAPNNATADTGQYINWKTLNKLKKSKLATIGMHPADYKDISSDKEEDIRRQINNAQASFRENIDVRPTLFAYPLGAYNNTYSDIIEDQEFEHVFGQHSGVALINNEVNAPLPRFTMTADYGDLDRFITTAHALPFPVSDITTAIKGSIGFTLPDELSQQADKLSCFVAGQEKPRIIAVSDSRIELKLKSYANRNRLRVNCTLPVKEENSDDVRWRWLGFLITDN